jgi:hypothetical protein
MVPCYAVESVRCYVSALFKRSIPIFAATIFRHSVFLHYCADSHRVLLQYISLVNPSISVGIEILRDGYEAFAMYCFGRYLVACLGTPLSCVI